MTSKDTPIHPPFSTGIWSRAPDHIQPSMDMEITSSPESAQVYCELNFPYSRYSCLLYMLLPDSIAKEELLMYNSQEAWLECVYKSYILTLQIKEKRRKGKESKGKGNTVLPRYRRYLRIRYSYLIWISAKLPDTYYYLI